MTTYHHAGDEYVKPKARVHRQRGDGFAVTGVVISPQMKEPNRILELRDALGLSLAELAAAMMDIQPLPLVNPQQLSRLEKGERGLSVDWCERIAPALDCKPWDLLPLTKSEEQEELEIRLRFRAMSREQKDFYLSAAKQLRGS